MSGPESPKPPIPLDEIRKAKQDKEAEAENQRIRELTAAKIQREGDLKATENTVSITRDTIHAAQERIEKLETPQAGNVISMGEKRELEDLRGDLKHEQEKLEGYLVTTQEARDDVRKMEEKLSSLGFKPEDS